MKGDHYMKHSDRSMDSHVSDEVKKGTGKSQHLKYK